MGYTSSKRHATKQKLKQDSTSWSKMFWPGHMPFAYQLSPMKWLHIIVLHHEINKKIGRLPWFTIDFSWLNSRFPPLGKPPCNLARFQPAKTCETYTSCHLPTKIALQQPGQALTYAGVAVVRGSYGGISKNEYQAAAAFGTAKWESIFSKVIPGTFNNGTPLWEVPHTIPIPLPQESLKIWE